VSGVPATGPRSFSCASFGPLLFVDPRSACDAEPERRAQW
jgi:hypothetical protein